MRKILLLPILFLMFFTNGQSQGIIDSWNKFGEELEAGRDAGLEENVEANFIATYPEEIANYLKKDDYDKAGEKALKIKKVYEIKGGREQQVQHMDGVLARMYARQGNKAEAIKSYTNYLALLHALEEDLEGAQWQKLNGITIHFTYELMKIYESLGQYDEALEYGMALHKAGGGETVAVTAMFQTMEMPEISMFLAVSALSYWLKHGKR